MWPAVDKWPQVTIQQLTADRGLVFCVGIMDETISTGTRTFHGSPEYMSVRYAAHVLDVSQETVRRWIRRNLVEYERFGRTIRIRSSSIHKK
jgi:excisionase family DNA binding protein